MLNQVVCSSDDLAHFSGSIEECAEFIEEKNSYMRQFFKVFPYNADQKCLNSKVAIDALSKLKLEEHKSRTLDYREGMYVGIEIGYLHARGEFCEHSELGRIWIAPLKKWLCLICENTFVE